MAIYKSKIATKDGRQYFFRIKYKDILGVTHDYSSPKFKTKKDAINEEALYKIKVMQKETNISTLTLEQIWFEYYNYQKDKVRKQTLNKINNQYSKYISFLGKVKINDFTVNHYKLFTKKMIDNKLSPVYCNKVQSLFTRLIKFSNKYYSTSTTILKHIETFKDVNSIKKEMLFFTYEEYLKFIDKVDENYKVFFEVLYFMGLRQGECLALNWNDIDFKNKTLNICKTLTNKIKGEIYTISPAKTKSSCRVLPIPERVLNDLKILYNSAIKYSDFSKDWFIFGNSMPFKETTVQNRKNKACALAEVKQIRIHDFRHSCASLLINKGASIALVSKYLGHSNISITLNTYTHMYQSELKNMVEILNKL
ncbi:MAG: site-specific integrase [Tenericutes bacterium]|nr:site-specific integrase [Mycoplasmatota bacterium]